MTGTSSSQTYRDDIQGLRTIGISLVVIFHIWINKVSGGVDVFFVVSGFLITITASRSLESGALAGTLSFWGRVITRILPAAILTIFATLLFASFLLPVADWKSLLQHAAESLFQRENIYLMKLSADYLARDHAPSPFQQFWALSLQMQFYLAAPFLILLIKNTARLWGDKANIWKAQFFMCLTIAAASFAYAWHLTAIDPEPAYFSPVARLWEFAVGMACAVAAQHLSVPPAGRRLMGWVGLAIILFCGMLIPVAWKFPGPAALIPVLGASLVILAGVRRVEGDVTSLLSSRPLKGLAPYSFPIYLWHWPILVFAMETVGGTALDLTQGTMVIVLSVAVTYCANRFVEQPLRYFGHPERWRHRPQWVAVGMPFATILLMLLPVGVISIVWKAHLHELRTAHRAQPTPTRPLDRLERPQATIGREITAQLVGAVEELPAPYRMGCHRNNLEAGISICVFGRDSPDAIRIALVGGSHSLHWLPALQQIATRHPVKILNITRSGCPFVGTLNDDDGREDACQQWIESAVQYLLREKPDFIFTTATRPTPNGVGDYMPDRYVEIWRKLVASGIDVIAIRDNPWLDVYVPGCVARNMAELDDCGVARLAKLSKAIDLSAIADISADIHIIDLSDYLCSADTCPAVIDDMLVYRDRHHLTVQFAKRLAMPLEERLLAAAPEIASRRTVPAADTAEAAPSVSVPSPAAAHSRGAAQQRRGEHEAEEQEGQQVEHVGE